MSPQARLEFLEFAHAKAVERQRYIGKLQAEFEGTDLALLEERWKDRENFDPDISARQSHRGPTKRLVPPISLFCRLPRRRLVW
jgi:hypothetical protein